MNQNLLDIFTKLTITHPRAKLPTWHDTLEAFSNKVCQARAGLAQGVPPTVDFLEDLFAGKNGVASQGSALANKAKLAVLLCDPDFQALACKLISSPTNRTLTEVKKAWKATMGITNKHLLNRAVIAMTDTVSAVADERKFRKAQQYLIDHCGYRPHPLTESWFHQNQDVMKFLYAELGPLVQAGTTDRTYIRIFMNELADNT